nr:zf-HC2 domain-containing protein [Ardenticatena sp.]
MNAAGTQITCEEVQKMMSHALDHELGDEQWQLLQAHIRACQECMETWQALRHLDTLLHAAPMATPPPGFAQHTASLAIAAHQRREWMWLLVALIGGIFALSGLLLATMMLASGTWLAFLTTPDVLVESGRTLLEGAQLLGQGFLVFFVQLNQVMFDQFLWLTVSMSLLCCLAWLVILRIVQRTAPVLVEA